jgi:hypothetical protein
VGRLSRICGWSEKTRAAAPRVYLIPLPIVSAVSMNKSNIPELKTEEFFYDWVKTKKVPLEAKSD